MMVRFQESSLWFQNKIVRFRWGSSLEKCLCKKRVNKVRFQESPVRFLELNSRFRRSSGERIHRTNKPTYAYLPFEWHQHIRILTALYFFGQSVSLHNQIKRWRQSSDFRILRIFILSLYTNVCWGYQTCPWFRSYIYLNFNNNCLFCGR